jgi:hypothetical protein
MPSDVAPSMVIVVALPSRAPEQHGTRAHQHMYMRWEWEAWRDDVLSRRRRCAYGPGIEADMAASASTPSASGSLGGTPLNETALRTPIDMPRPRVGGASSSVFSSTSVFSLSAADDAGAGAGAAGAGAAAAGAGAAAASGAAAGGGSSAGGRSVAGGRLCAHQRRTRAAHACASLRHAPLSLSRTRARASLTHGG